jgi:organic hydroperoxide reductase OsmC/OhrA
LERQVAEALVDAAHQTCPYSKLHAATSMCIQLERDHGRRHQL